MAEEFLLVSCDIVGYSAEPDIALQLQRAQAVNDMIRPAVAAAGSDQGFWFSGGDGGHVAFTGATAPGKALQLLLDLRTWSITSQVPLRIAGCVGLGERFTGADGRVDMVGPGVNLAARLLQYAGSDLRIVVTDAFRGRCNGLTSVAATFHEPRVVRGPFPHPQQVWLVSGPGQSPSKWAPPFGLAPDAEQDDRADLRRAVARADGLAVLYRAKRLLQVNSSDAEALQALRDSMGPPPAISDRAGCYGSCSPNRISARNSFAQPCSWNERKASCCAVPVTKGERCC